MFTISPSFRNTCAWESKVLNVYNMRKRPNDDSICVLFYRVFTFLPSNCVAVYAVAKAKILSIIKCISERRWALSLISSWGRWCDVCCAKTKTALSGVALSYQIILVKEMTPNSKFFVLPIMVASSYWLWFWRWNTIKQDTRMNAPTFWFYSEPGG